MYIFRLKIHILRLRMHILNLKMNLLHGQIGFVSRLSWICFPPNSR